MNEKDYDKIRISPSDDIRHDAELTFDAYKNLPRDYSDICPRYGQGDTALRAAAFIDGYMMAIANYKAIKS